VGFARKVIETVVQAVDERLGEYAKQMEHRLAEFEARLAEARGRFDAGIVAAHNRVEGGMRGLAESEERLREEIRSVADSSSGFDASAAEAAIEMKLTPLRGEVAEVRQRMAEGDRTVAEMAAVQHRVEWDVQGFAESQEKLRDEIRRVAESSSSFDASAADAAIELKLAPLRAEIAEMRQRLAESDHTSLDLILAIGQMCRQAAGRIADSAPLPPESAPPLSNAEPPLNGTGDSLHAVPEEPVDPPLESAAPAFTQLKKATALWRFPAVSSFLLAAGGLLLLHYL
jgi:chromosome segregation ATPase